MGPKGAQLSCKFPGGDRWTRDQRRTFANDPDNLLPVEDNLNQSKGSKDPDEWLPPNTEFRDIYIRKFIHISEKYELNPMVNAG